jgi:ABC-2 type transport system ATP-binding protein
MITETLELRNLCYSTHHFLLSDISFSLPNPSLTLLQGPNGSGKSTLIKLIIGLLHPQSGYIHHRPALPQIGYLPDVLPLYEDLTPNAYLKFLTQLRKLPASTQEHTLQTWLHDCDLDRYQHTPIKQLSRGVKQRIGIAQAMIHHPTLLLLDEPTHGLDSKHITALTERLHHVKQHTKILLVTHDRTPFLPIIDHTLSLYEDTDGHFNCSTRY